MLRKQEKNYKDQHSRKLEKFSNNFNQIFFFFLKSYRKGLLTFAGSEVKVEFNPLSFSSRECFRRFDDGYFKNKELESRQNNIVQGVIIGKKSWGLHVKMWSQGIAEGCFTKREILEDFEKHNIQIPDSLLKDFENWIYKETQKRNCSL